MQQLKTRFTERFSIDHPVMLAPMDKVAGGPLAAAVSLAGGLGMIGGGYGDPDWLEDAFSKAGNHPVGVGFISWSLQRSIKSLDIALDHSPELLMVSFGDAENIIAACCEAGVPTCWQVQRLEQARQAIAAGVDVIVVQGQEAGGHGMDRGLMSLLPAVRDLASRDQIILAAGGIADGRGLASALMLGADGIMMGTRFWASTEATGSDQAKQQITQTSGDQTIRTKVFDIAREVDWPMHYTGRVVHNDFSKQWHTDLNTLADSQPQKDKYNHSDENDYQTRVLIAGEATDLIHSIQPATEIIDTTVEQAVQLLSAAPSFLR